MSNWNRHNPNNPFECCMNCADRHPACSDHCEKHEEARKIKAKQNRKDNLDAALGRAEKIRPLRNAKKK